MRNAALVLGLIGGALALVVGFFGYGYVEFIDWFGEVPQVAEQVENPDQYQAMAILSPILAIAGGAMARSRALVGGLLMLAGAGALYMAFGFGVFTVFPIALTALGGILAIAAGRPDEEVSHF